MKKLFLSLSVVCCMGLFLTSCSDDAKDCCDCSGATGQTGTICEDNFPGGTGVSWEDYKDILETAGCDCD